MANGELEYWRTTGIFLQKPENKNLRPTRWGIRLSSKGYSGRTREKKDPIRYHENTHTINTVLYGGTTTVIDLVMKRDNKITRILIPSTDIALICGYGLFDLMWILEDWSILSMYMHKWIQDLCIVATFIILDLLIFMMCICAIYINHDLTAPRQWRRQPSGNTISTVSRNVEIV